METTLSHKPAVMDAPEDIALADKMNAGRKRIEEELAKLIDDAQNQAFKLGINEFMYGILH